MYCGSLFVFNLFLFWSSIRWSIHHQVAACGYSFGILKAFLQQVVGYLQQWKWLTQYSWNIVASCVEHQQSKPIQYCKEYNLPSVRNIDTFTVCIYVCFYPGLAMCHCVCLTEFYPCFCCVVLYRLVMCLCVLPRSVPLSLIECVFNNSTIYRWFKTYDN